jgi:hypothetical protein
MSIKHKTLVGMVYVLLYEQKLWPPSSKIVFMCVSNSQEF